MHFGWLLAKICPIVRRQVKICILRKIKRRRLHSHGKYIPNRKHSKYRGTYRPKTALAEQRLWSSPTQTTIPFRLSPGNGRYDAGAAKQEIRKDCFSCMLVKFSICPALFRPVWIVEKRVKKTIVRTLVSTKYGQLRYNTFSAVWRSLPSPRKEGSPMDDNSIMALLLMLLILMTIKK